MRIHAGIFLVLMPCLLLGCASHKPDPFDFVKQMEGAAPEKFIEVLHDQLRFSSDSLVTIEDGLETRIVIRTCTSSRVVQYCVYTYDYGDRDVDHALFRMRYESDVRCWFDSLRYAVGQCGEKGIQTIRGGPDTKNHYSPMHDLNVWVPFGGITTDECGLILTGGFGGLGKHHEDIEHMQPDTAGIEFGIMALDALGVRE